MNEEKLKKLKEIAKLLDPDNTFLDDCEEVVEERFGKKAWIKAGFSNNN